MNEGSEMWKYIIYLFIIVIYNDRDILLAGTIDPKVPDQSYVEYAKSFNYIGKVRGNDKNSKVFVASGVCVSPNIILTAAHVLKDTSTSAFILDDTKYPLCKIKCHEEFNDNVFGYYDIAIGYTEKPILLNFYPELYESSDEEHKLCCISGYGLTGTFNTGAKKYDDIRRAGSNMIDRIDRQLLICSPSLLGSKNHTSLEFLIASGDSGGGLFIDGKLAGINSCVISEIKGGILSTYGNESGHTRVSRYVEWIKSNMKELNEKK